MSDAQVRLQLKQRLVPFCEDLEALAAEHTNNPGGAKRLVTELLQEAATSPQPTVPKTLRIASAEDFAGVKEDGAAAILGTSDSALIPENADVCVYGNGGAGKTTLTVDVAAHLAAGDDWLGITVPEAKRVLLIENEGPRPFFRTKLDRKIDGWQGSPLAGRLSVLEEPWSAFTFADDGWCRALAEAVREAEIDVIVAGPVTRLGMEDAGTLQHVRDFLVRVNSVRVGAGRPLTVILVHHENKNGTVSGAWEGSGDTLIHLETHSQGATTMHVQKARWSPEHHGTKLVLAWTPGEGYEVKDDRPIAAEITKLLSDCIERTAEQIRMPKSHKRPGIGASRKTVEAALQGMQNVVSREGDSSRASGLDPDKHESAKATYYGLNPDRIGV